SVVDASAPGDGVVIGNVCPPSSGSPATIAISCPGGPGTLTLPDGGAIVGTCGSFRNGTISGTATFAFGPPGHETEYVLHESPGSTAIISDLGNDTFAVFNKPTNGASISVSVGVAPNIYNVTMPSDSAITVHVVSAG